ncbi:unnamed protein product [Larinioides sclopetarius]|uniref:MD-2-related lipid-recognition domain-containing protein n=1 Tax=Larinioides sclopetarius TaxID=280406 RepID=A0AAV1Z0U9_9ARAC
MKTLLFMLCCLYLISCGFVYAIDWDKCGSGKQILQLWKFRIFPVPLRLKGNNTQIGLQADLYEDMPDDARIQIQVWKVRKIFWDMIFKVPCFLPTGCDVDLCSFLEYFGGKSVCPLKAQLFEVNDIEIIRPVVDNFARSFELGRFWIQLKIIGPNSEQLSCWSFIGEANDLE